MSAGENADERQPDHIVLAADYTAQRFFQVGGLMGYSDSGLRRHCWILLSGARLAELPMSLDLSFWLLASAFEFGLRRLHSSSRVKRGTLVFLPYSEREPENFLRLRARAKS